MNEYIIIKNCQFKDKIGLIYEVKGRAYIDYERKGVNIFTKPIEKITLTLQEADFYVKFEQERRLKAYENCLIEKISDLQIDDICVIKMKKQEIKIRVRQMEVIDGEMILEYESINEQSVKIRVSELDDISDIQRMKGVEYFMIKKHRYLPSKVGCIFEENGLIIKDVEKKEKSFLCRLFEVEKINLSLDEVKFYVKFPKDKRIMAYNNHLFDKSNVLQMNDVCIMILKDREFHVKITGKVTVDEETVLDFQRNDGISQRMPVSLVDDIYDIQQMQMNDDNGTNSIADREKAERKLYAKCQKDSSLGSLASLRTPDLMYLPDIELKIIYPYNLVSVENGEQLRKSMLLKVGNKTRVLNIKWRGIINGNLCVGAELYNATEYGTNGMFDMERLFHCENGKGILVPINSLKGSCEKGCHQKIVFDGHNPSTSLSPSMMFVNKNNICCVEWLDKIQAHPKLEIGNNIKYKTCEQAVTGTCEWIGLVNGMEAVGMKMNNNCNGSNGIFNNFELFRCPKGRGFIFLASDVIDEDFNMNEESKRVYHGVSVRLVEGLHKGIQGAANTCFIESALFALFVNSDILDFMISPINVDNELDYDSMELREILKWKIVCPLREFGFVSFHKMNKMKNAEKFRSLYTAIMKEETNVALSILLSKLCPNQHLLKFVSSEKKTFPLMTLQLFFILERASQVLTCEEMINFSMIQNKMTFAECPTCFIVQPPRDGKGSRCYNILLPSNVIEISQICSEYRNTCHECGEVALYQCATCLETNSFDIGLCFLCEQHRCGHEAEAPIIASEIKSNSKVFMELKAIICHYQSHFVSYVKEEILGSNTMNDSLHQRGSKNQWFLYDGMYSVTASSNSVIPRVCLSKQVSEFLQMATNEMKNTILNSKTEEVERIVKDSYIFVYHNKAKTCY